MWLIRSCAFVKKTYFERPDRFNVQWIKSYTWGKKLWSRLWVVMWSSTSKVFWCVWNASVKVSRIKVSVWCDISPESCDLQMQIKCVSQHAWEKNKTSLRLKAITRRPQWGSKQGPWTGGTLVSDHSPWCLAPGSWSSVVWKVVELINTTFNVI